MRECPTLRKFASEVASVLVAIVPGHSNGIQAKSCAAWRSASSRWWPPVAIAKKLVSVNLASSVDPPVTIRRISTVN